MTHTAHGTFDVKITPMPPEENVGDAGIGRLALHKQFRGDLDAIASIWPLPMGTEVKGSAGYVAMDRVSGALHGRSGSFGLQHSGTMDRGAAQLRIAVVPDSGTGELTGISGVLAIDIRDGQHFYTFDYQLPDPS